MLIIRDIEEKDLQDYVEMAKTFYNSPACIHQIPEENFFATFEECMRSKEHGRILMLEDEQGIAGYALLAVSWSAEAGGLVIWLEEIYLKEETRGKGYGTRIFAWVEEAYPQARRFRLEATRSNERAIALYARLGYEELPYYQMIKDRT